MVTASKGEQGQSGSALTGRLRAERTRGQWLLWPEGEPRPDPAWFVAANRCMAADDTARAGRGATTTFVAAGRVVLLRHYHRGGMVRHLAADRYPWCGLRRSRPWRELAVLAHLAALGLAVPRPVGARVVGSRGSLAYRGDLLTEYLADTVALSALIQGGTISASQWQRVGATIAEFHRAGLDHADLNAHNVLIDAGGCVHLIDFDRARLRRPGGWYRRNLARLRRSVDKVAEAVTSPAFTEQAWQHLLAGYRSG